MTCTKHTIRRLDCAACYPLGRETAKAAYERRQAEAEARELRDLREDTLKGLDYALTVHARSDNERSILGDARDVVATVWPS